MKTMFKKILLAYAERYEIKCGENDLRSEWQKWFFNGHSHMADAAFTYVKTMLTNAPTDATHIRFSHGMTYFHKVSIKTWQLGNWNGLEIPLGEHTDLIAIDDIKDFIGENHE